VETFDLLIRLIGTGCTVLVAVLGLNVFRLKVTQQAEHRLGQIQIETIEAQREQIATLRTQSRLVEEIANRDRVSREQCEEALKLAHQALDTWDNLVGQIWIDASIRIGDGHEFPAAEPRDRAGDALDSGELPERDEGPAG
jgi:hypothetical protein